MKNNFVVRYHHDIVTVPVKVNVFVKQQSQILYQQIIDLRYFQSPLRIEFEFDTLDPISLVFETQCLDMDLYPFYIDRIEFDDLIDVPFAAHSGKLTSSTAQADLGNCLYCDGQLVYTFSLPLCSNANIQ